MFQDQKQKADQSTEACHADSDQLGLASCCVFLPDCTNICSVYSIMSCLLIVVNNLGIQSVITEGNLKTVTEQLSYTTIF